MIFDDDGGGDGGKTEALVDVFFLFFCFVLVVFLFVFFCSSLF